MLDELEMAKWAKVRRRGMLHYVFVRGAIGWGFWMIACFYFVFWLGKPSSIVIGLIVFPVAGCLLFYRHWQWMEDAYFERRMFDANRPTHQIFNT